MDKKTIETAYTALRHVTTDLANANRSVMDAKFDLERAKAIVTNAGKVEGKNVEQRNAHMRLMLRKKTDRLQEREGQLQFDKFRHELVMLQVKEVNLLTQLYIANAENNIFPDIDLSPQLDRLKGLVEEVGELGGDHE